MAFVPVARVLETGSGSGTGNVTLLGAQGSGEYDAFNERLSVNDSTFYVIVDGALFEIGYGTYSAATPNNGTFTRDTVIRSSSGTSQISLSGSNFNIFGDIPAEKTLTVDSNGLVTNVSSVAGAVIPKNFAAMKALAEPSDNTVVGCGYGSTEGDGLGGLFRWDDTSTATADDLDVLELDDVGSSPGRWIRERQSLFLREAGSDPSNTDEILRRSDTIDIKSNRSDTGVKIIPEVQTVARHASYATLAALKAVASSNWKQGDLIELRGISAEGDIPSVVGTWQASSTNTDSLDVTFVRPDDIAGANPGRVQFPVDINVAESTLTIATGAVTVTRAAHAIAAESSTADDLDTVTTTGFPVGATIRIRPDTGDTITVKNGTGNITTDTGGDIILDAVTDYCTLTVTAGGVVASFGSGLVTADGSTTARSLAARFAECTNVKDFGATGNGSTDDTSALQAAFTYAASNGKRLYFPRGTYIHTATIGTISASDWFIYGEDPTGTILSCNADTDAIIIDASAAQIYRVSIKGLEFLNTHGTGLNSTGVKVSASTGSVTGLRQSRFENLSFRGVGRGIALEDTGKTADGGGFTSIADHGFNSFINLQFPQYSRYPTQCVHFEGGIGPHNLFIGGQYRADTTSGSGILAGTGANSISVGDTIITGIHFVLGSEAVKLVGPGDGAYKASCAITSCQFDVMTNYSYHIENLDRLRVWGNNTLIGVDANIVNCDLKRSIVETRDEAYIYGLRVNYESTADNLVAIKGGDASTTNPTIEIQGSSTDASLSLRSKGTGKLFLGQHRANYLGVAGSNSTGERASLEALGSDTDINLQLVPKGAGTTIIYGTAPEIAAEGAATNIDLIVSGKGTGDVILSGQRTNYILAQGHNTGAAPTLKPDGGDTNIGLNIYAKGSGTVMIGFTGQTVGFYGSAGTTKQTVTGSRGSNAALASLLTALAGYGLITDSSS